MLFPNFLDVRPWVAVTQCMLWCKGRRRRSEEMEIETIQIIHRTTVYHPFSITSVISFYVKKWCHFHSNEVQSRAAQCCHLPIDHYANSHTVHRCNKRSRDGWRKHLLESPESSQQQRTGFGFLSSQAFVRVYSQMSFCTTIWPGYELLNGSSTCFPSPFLHRPYFVQMGLHRAGH